jgi:hypothetical protein
MLDREFSELDLNNAIPFFDKPFTFSEKGLMNPFGKQPLETSLVRCNYLLRCPDREPVNDDRVSCRDFKDSNLTSS